MKKLIILTSFSLCLLFTLPVILSAWTTSNNVLLSPFFKAEITYIGIESETTKISIKVTNLTDQDLEIKWSTDSCKIIDDDMNSYNYISASGINVDGEDYTMIAASSELNFDLYFEELDAKPSYFTLYEGKNEFGFRGWIFKEVQID